MQKTILIAGPTASGKSALALELAGSHGGSIINADSMQVYRDLRIITARPTAEDVQRVAKMYLTAEHRTVAYTFVPEGGAK